MSGTYEKVPSWLKMLYQTAICSYYAAAKLRSRSLKSSMNNTYQVVNRSPSPLSPP